VVRGVSEIRRLDIEIDVLLAASKALQNAGAKESDASRRQNYGSMSKGRHSAA